MSRQRRSVVVLLGFFLLVGLGGYWVSTNFFPHLWDQEAENPVELKTLEQATLTPSPTVNGSDSWPQWLGPNRNASITVPTLRSNWAEQPPRKLWEVPCGGGHSSFALQGLLYTMEYRKDAPNGAEEAVVCMNPKTGETIFRYAYQVDYSSITGGYDNGPRATPAIVAGNLFIIGAAGNLKVLKLPESLQNEANQTAAQPTLLYEATYPVPTWGSHVRR